jgi:host cell surface-exposed lipoprotein
VHTRHTNGALAALAAAGVLTALLFGSVTAAHATPISRANALRAAKQYLRTAPFSFKGLVSQLKYERYSTSDARYGASHSGANWMKQAVRAAKQYLRTAPFSFQGLVEQLEYEGFTHAQAVHGARAAGL